MAEEQPKKRIRKPKEVSAGPKTAPASRTTAPEEVSASEMHPARVRKPVQNAIWWYTYDVFRSVCGGSSAHDCRMCLLPCRESRFCWG